MLECSPPARQRRAAGEVGATDERLRSEDAATEAAWPRSQTADGGRSGTETETETETGTEGTGYPRRMSPSRVAQSMRTASGFSTRTWRTLRLSQIASCSSSQS